MKLTSKQAKQILDEVRKNIKDDGWIIHSINVGYCAKKIASSLVKRDIVVDVDKAVALGYIHDIGKYNGEYHNHVMNGYRFLKDKGYDEEYCNVCLTHSYLNNDINCTAGALKNKINPVLENFIKNHEYTIEEKIINLCDLMCPPINKIYTVDKRLIEMIIRKGINANTQYHIKEAYKLKEYFDNLIGFNIYDLFTEIKKNL